MPAKQEVDLGRYFDIEGVRIDTRRVDRALRRVPGLLQEELLDGLTHIRKGFFKALYAYTGLKDKRFIATKNVGIGRHIRVYRNPRKGDILDIQLGIFSRSGQVKIHETGGEIEAPPGRRLTIPIGEALDPATGRVKKWFRNTKKSFARDELFIFRSKKGQSFLVKRSGEKLLFYFVLRNKVKILPRYPLRFYDTWDRMEGYRMETLNKHVERALNKE
jgi:hypothetical protein